MSRLNLSWTTVVVSLGLGTLLGLAPQERQIVSNEVGVSQREASLQLEFADGGTLSVVFRDGVIRVDGEELGRYKSGDDLDAEWRALLGQAIALREDALAEALVAWAPPADFGEDRLSVARALDQALEQALSFEVAEEEPAANVAAQVVVGEREGDVSLRSLMNLVRERERLVLLAEAMEDLDVEELGLFLDENVVVAVGETVDQSVVVVNGDLEVRGVIDGDAVVMNGTVHLYDEGRIDGDLRLVSGSRLFRDGGEVTGRIRTVDETELGGLDEATREEIRRGIRDAVDVSVSTGRNDSFRNPFRNITRGLGGLMENLVTFMILALAGLASLYFLPDRLEVVAETVQQAPARAAVVGIAGGFLLLPVWVLGMVILAVSIVGIPVLLAWIPLFPVAAGLAAWLGYLAVARNIGSWLAEREIQWLDWIRSSSTFSLILGGLAALMAAFVAANLLRMGGSLFGIFRVLLTTVGTMSVILAMVVGFGGVLLSRGGTRRNFAEGVAFDFDIPEWTPRRPWRKAWESADRGPADTTEAAREQERTGEPEAEADQPHTPEGSGPDADEGSAEEASEDPSAEGDKPNA
jgi:hypothetical protein